MVPSFNSDGLLPPGIHFCIWEEFVFRFGTTQHRLALIAGLKTAMKQLQSVGCSTIYIDGSFVTHKLIPGDFDACWDESGVDLSQLKSIAPVLLKLDEKQAMQKETYGGEVFPASLPTKNHGISHLEFFQMSRDGNLKGIIAIDLVRRQA